MSSRSRYILRQAYPRLVSFTLNFLVKSGTTIPNTIFATIPIQLIYQALRDNNNTLQGSTQGGNIGGNTVTIVPAQLAPATIPLATAQMFDPTLEKLSFAGIVCVAPGNLTLASFTIGGKDMGMGVDNGTTGTLLAEILSFSPVSLKILKIANAPPPDAIPLQQDIQLIAVVTTANLPADQTIAFSVACWVTPREDLVK